MNDIGTLSIVKNSLLTKILIACVLNIYKYNSLFSDKIVYPLYIKNLIHLLKYIKYWKHPFTSSEGVEWSLIELCFWRPFIKGL